jgi:hypothetical protein
MNTMKLLIVVAYEKDARYYLKAKEDVGKRTLQKARLMKVRLAKRSEMPKSLTRAFGDAHAARGTAHKAGFAAKTYQQVSADYRKFFAGRKDGSTI